LPLFSADQLSSFAEVDLQLEAVLLREDRVVVRLKAAIRHDQARIAGVLT
jgi:hypothetical protein